MKQLRRAILLATALMLLSTLLMGCVGVNINYRGTNRNEVLGTGQIQTRQYPVQPYSKLNIGSNIVLTYSNSSADYIDVSAYENLFDYLNISVKDDTLYIDSDANIGSGQNQAPKVTIYTSNFQELLVRGGVVMDNSDPIQGDSFSLRISGAATIEAELQVKTLNANIAGASTTELWGSVEDMQLSISGVGTVDAERLQSKTAKVTLSGLGGATIYCTDELDASLSGMGSLEYKGNPTIINKKVTGMGDISQL